MTPNHRSPIYDLIVEIRGAFNDLKALSDHMNADLDITAAARAVMEFLYTNGPNTVPRIAAQKNVSRQHVQLLADALVEKSLAHYVDNPQHKRSKLVELTQDGHQMFDQIATREAKGLQALETRFQAEDVALATKTLRTLRQVITNQTG